MPTGASRSWCRVRERPAVLDERGADTVHCGTARQCEPVGPQFAKYGHEDAQTPDDDGGTVRGEPGIVYPVGESLGGQCPEDIFGRVPAQPEAVEGLVVGDPDLDGRNRGDRSADTDDRGDIERRVGQALELVRLGPLAQRGIGQLSGGQRQRVALARAIVFQPRVILMDEPLSALDKQLREQMQLEIKHLHHEIGATTVYVTHDQREALTMSDRIAVFSQGRIEQIGTPEQIYRTPQSAFVAEFIGESTLIPVHVQPGRLSIENVHADLPLALQLMTGDCSLVARPEIFQILQEGVRPEKDFITFPATVREVIFQGDSVLVCSEVAGKQLVSARVSSTRGSHGFIPNQGSSIRLAVHFSDIVTVGRR